MNIFERACRAKLRFNVAQGVLSTEDLWDLSLSKLDKIAISLNKTIKESETESFVNVIPNNELTADKLRFDLVLHVIEAKKSQAEATKKAVETRKRRDMLLDLKAKKETEALEGLSAEEIEKELAALGA